MVFPLCLLQMIQKDNLIFLISTFLRKFKVNGNLRNLSVTLYKCNFYRTAQKSRK